MGAYISSRLNSTSNHHNLSKYRYLNIAQVEYHRTTIRPTIRPIVMAKYWIFLEHRDRVKLFAEVWCLVIRYTLYDDNSYLVSLQKECSRVTADRCSWMSFPLLQAPRSSSIMQPIPVSAESSETAKITASQCSRISASEFSPRDSLIADTRAGRIFG